MYVNIFQKEKSILKFIFRDLAKKNECYCILRIQWLIELKKTLM